MDDRILGFVLGIVAALVMGVVIVSSWAMRSDLRDSLQQKEKEVRDRDSGKLPYDYVPHTKHKEKK